jgi:two-component system nitrogen regulation sensor histidine kinase NtrY
METVLSKRIKIIILIVLAVIFFWLIGGQLFRADPLERRDNIYRNLERDIGKIEGTLGDKIRQFKERAEVVYESFESGSLAHAQLDPGESLVLEKSGVVEHYYGEIYYVKLKPLPVGNWVFLEKNHRVYFLYKMAEHVFYLNYFLDIRQNFILRRLKFPQSFAELKLVESTLPTNVEKFEYDGRRDMFFYQHVLDRSNEQLLLVLRFSQQGVENYFKKRRNLWVFLIVIGILFLLGAILMTRRSLPEKIFSAASFSAAFLLLFFIVKSYGERDLFVNILGVRFDSIFEILIGVAFLNYILYIALRRFRNKNWGLVLFNVFLFPVAYLIEKVLQSVNFFYSEFNFHWVYLGLVTVLCLFHLLPHWFIRRIQLEKSLSAVLKFVLCQFLFFLIFLYAFGRYYHNFLILSLLLFILLFFRKGLVVRLGALFLAAISIFLFISAISTGSKQEFIQNNLKNIFLNQKNYAKLIAREIVHEINSTSDDFKEFFSADSADKLERIWRNSLASKENAASGIFVISRDKRVISRFADQIPYIDVKKGDFFPFWTIEETDAFLYGKEISLAIASIAVFDKTQLLGYIIIQVQNSPELILKDRDNINIFTINKRIDRLDLSYLKLSKENKILENPANINLQNISGMLKSDNRWLDFKYMDLNFKGFIFREDVNYIVIFYPEKTMVKNFSEVIKIFLFLLLFFVLFYFKELRRLEWRAFYYSFSIRVFTILILISLLTAVVFSIFSLNFNSETSRRYLRKLVFERGRAAQNIVNNVIKEEGEFGQNQLFFLSRMIEQDVSVYQRGILLFTSNYKWIIESRIPEYLHSNILNLLEERNQKFELEEDRQSFQLYFKIDDYIFNIDFVYKGGDFISGRESYADFIITLFFVMVISGFSAAFFFRNKILSPINTLNQKMAEVKTGNLSNLERIPSEEELKSLYLGFNSMVEGIREQRKNVSEISRMKTLVNLGRRVAHEVKNPLTPIKLSAEQIQRSLVDKRENYEETIRKSVQFIIDETEHLKKVSYGFLDLSRLEEIDGVEFDIVGLLREEVLHFKQIYSTIEFVTDCGSDRLNVRLDQVKIKQVVKNILLNSIEAIGDGPGQIQIILRESADHLTMQFIDNGIGMDDEEIRLIFEEDYSTKETGVGIGMFIIKRIVDLHRGKITFESVKGRGTTVTIRLPRDVLEV